MHALTPVRVWCLPQYAEGIQLYDREVSVNWICALPPLCPAAKTVNHSK